MYLTLLNIPNTQKMTNLGSYRLFFVKGPVRKIKVFVSKSYLCRNMVARAECLVYSPNTAAPQGGKCNGHSRLA